MTASLVIRLAKLGPLAAGERACPRTTAATKRGGGHTGDDVRSSERDTRSGQDRQHQVAAPAAILRKVG